LIERTDKDNGTFNLPWHTPQKRADMKKYFYYEVWCICTDESRDATDYDWRLGREFSTHAAAKLAESAIRFYGDSHDIMIQRYESRLEERFAD
jgi:hypothetical protein